MVVISAMACSVGCSKSHSHAVQEEKTEAMTDTAAPEGVLKGYFLIASKKVLPGDFLEAVTDSSKYVEGFRNIRMLRDEVQIKELLECSPVKPNITKPDFDISKVLGLTWDEAVDCYEEQESMVEFLEKEFQPDENGLYEMEIVASDIYGNASVAKVYVLYDKAALTLSELQGYVDEMESKTNGFDRGKAEEAFGKVNEQRRENGVHELVWDESLYELACIRAQEIVSYFSHQRPDGSYVGDIIISQYGAAGCGENIASNYKSTTNLVNGWLNSQGHRENMLDGRFTAGVMACYCHHGSYYWVNLFKQ